MKLKVGQVAPDFTLPSQLNKDLTFSDLRGKTVVIAFFPLAWTPIWTGQIPSYEALLPKFAGLNVQVLGISVDHVPCLQAWSESLEGITYPLLSDFWPHGKVAKKYGVLRKDGRSERAIFIIDKKGIIRYIDIHDIDDQPSNEVLVDELRKIIPQEFRFNEDSPFGEEELPQGGVVMYCTQWCPDCRKARAWLEEHNIPFKEVDITTNFKASRQVRSWGNGYQITPTFDIDGTIILDFDVEKLEETLLK